MAKTNVLFRSADKITMQSLYRWNMSLAGIHALQGIVILILSTTKVFPVQTSYLTVDSIASQVAGHPVLVSATRHLFDLNLAYLIAAFFFMSAVAHAVVATISRARYEADLNKKINRFRWIEYAVSASTMMVAIALLSGVSDLSTLIAIFALTGVMNLCGLAMEVYNQNKNKVQWLAYIIGCVAGIAPWIVIAVYITGSKAYGTGSIPAFVYWIYASMFILFGSFAVNMFLQYRKTGNWKQYLYGERVYMLLSLIAKTALAWQIFAGTLRP